MVTCLRSFYFRRLIASPLKTTNKNKTSEASPEKYQVGLVKTLSHRLIESTVPALENDYLISYVRSTWYSTTGTVL